MTRKDVFKNDLLMKMKYQLGTNELAMLDSALSECLYQVDIVDSVTLPATISTSNDYILELYELKRSLVLKPSTMKGYMIAARELIRYIPKPLVAMESDDIEYYLWKKKKEGNTGTSLNNKRRKLLALFEWMKKQNFIQRNPVDAVERFKEVRKPVEYLLAEDIEQLKEGCKNRRDRALLEYFRSTACRRGEIPYVKINQVDWNTGKILMYGEKTDEWRNVFLDGVAIKYIKEYILLERKLDLNSPEPLFTRMRGDKTVALSKAGIYTEIKRIATDSGINKRVYPHIYRHTVATNVIRRGGSVYDAGCYLGHKGSDVTQRYYIAQRDSEEVFRKYVQAI